MKIIVEIGHPAHVHQFKNMIWELESRGHKIKVVAKKKEISHYLLNAYNISFEGIGINRIGLLKKAYSVFESDAKLLKISKRFKPDIFISRVSPVSGHVSKLLHKPHVSFADTEHSWLSDIISMPFTDVVITPFSYQRDLGKKQVRYEGYKELAYLHPNYFKPDPSVLDDLGLGKDDKFIILRFVAWQASHDIGQKGFDLETKRKLVKELEKYGRVLITSEKPLPKEFEKYRITAPPERIHDLLYHATIYIGEGATIATESAVLGTPSIFVNSLANKLGNFIELEQKYGLVFNYWDDLEKAIEKVLELIQQPNLKQEWVKKRKKLLKDKIDVTAFMSWFIEKYPKSFKIMKENPEYQERFK